MAKILVDREVLEQALALVKGPDWGTSRYMDMKVYEDAHALSLVLEAALDQAEEVFEHAFTEYEPDSDTGFVK